MTIKKIREKTGLSQSKFSELTGVPLRTIQSWEQGWRKPPDYAVNLIYKVLKYENRLQ